MRWNTIRPLLLVAVLVCACTTTSTPTRRRWYDSNGKPADQTALLAARDRCRERVQVVSRPGRGENVEWGLAMVDCMREEGFVQVSDDPNLAH